MNNRPCLAQNCLRGSCSGGNLKAFPVLITGKSSSSLEGVFRSSQVFSCSPSPRGGACRDHIKPTGMGGSAGAGAALRVFVAEESTEVPLQFLNLGALIEQTLHKVCSGQLFPKFSHPSVPWRCCWRLCRRHSL